MSHTQTLIGLEYFIIFYLHWVGALQGQCSLEPIQHLDQQGLDQSPFPNLGIFRLYY